MTEWEFVSWQSDGDRELALQILIVHSQRGWNNSVINLPQAWKHTCEDVKYVLIGMQHKSGGQLPVKSLYTPADLAVWLRGFRWKGGPDVLQAKHQHQQIITADHPASLIPIKLKNSALSEKFPSWTLSTQF